jgi:hypothetical protein
MARAVTCPSLRPCACAHVVRSQTTSQGGWGMLRRCGGCPQGAGGGRASSCTWKHGLQEHGRQAQQPAATFSRGNGVMAKIPRGFTRSQPQEPACHLVPARAATWRWARAGARSADECVERLDGRAGRARACQGGGCGTACCWLNMHPRGREGQYPRSGCSQRVRGSGGPREAEMIAVHDLTSDQTGERYAGRDPEHDGPPGQLGGRSHRDSWLWLVGVPAWGGVREGQGQAGGAGSSRGGTGG